MSHAAPSSAPPTGPRACQNCGAPLTGPYCSACGQHDVDYHRSFHHLLHDLLENLFHFEGKFFATVAWLLSHPGRLTREFLAGRRQSQLNPLRFYLFVSVLFFLGLTLFSHGHLLDFDRQKIDALTTGVESSLRTAQKLHGTLTPAQVEEFSRQIGELIDRTGAQPDQKTLAEVVARVRAAVPPDATLPPAAARTGSRISIDRDSAIGRALSDKLGSGELTFSTIIDGLEHRVPTLLFLGVPLFALLLQLAFLRSGRFYIEHLIFSLHLHTWLFLVAMLGNGYLRLAGLFSGRFAAFCAWALALWMLWYVAQSFRVVYGQGWGRTALKLSLLGIAYFFLLLLTATLLIYATIYWLTVA